MAREKSPNPAGFMTGFPYQHFWEELEPNWESFRVDPESLVYIQAHFEAAKALGAPPHLCLEESQIEELLVPLELTAGRREQLALHLYLLAGIYLGREHRKLLNRSPDHIRDRLQYISKAAKQLNGALTIVTPEALAMLNLIRPIVPGIVQPGDQFRLLSLLDVTRDLALTADCIAEEIPRQKRGPTTDVLRGRWIWSATMSLKQWANVQVRALQSDTIGRRARLEGTPGEVLQDYFRLVDPKIRIGTIVRVIAERRRALRQKPAL